MCKNIYIVYVDIVYVGALLTIFEEICMQQVAVWQSSWTSKILLELFECISVLLFGRTCGENAKGFKQKIKNRQLLTFICKQIYSI